LAQAILAQGLDDYPQAFQQSPLSRSRSGPVSAAMAPDMSEYVMVEESPEFLRLAREASAMEGEAVQLDLQGRAAAAAEGYRRAAARLREAAAACPTGHPDSQVLGQHARAVLARAEYLEGLGGAPAAPLEEHLLLAQAASGSPAGCTREASSGRRPARVMGAAAAVGGATGLLVLGPLGGAALGAATALATTREDRAGTAARKLGDAGLRLYARAKKVDREHGLSRRAASAGRRVVGKARQSLCELSEGNGVLGNLSKGLCIASSALTGAAGALA